MSSILTKGPALLRRSVSALRGLASFVGIAPAPGGKGSVVSPRIRRAIDELRGRANRRAGGPRTGSDRGQALAYRVRPELVVCRTRPGFEAVDVPPVTRFQVADADRALLGFFGKAVAGFHVFELGCAGLERLWRDDLARVLETRRPIVGRFAVSLESGHAEFEHVALPVVEAGRVVAIRGWFDQIDGTGISLRQIDWGKVRHVRRPERSRSITLPDRLMRADARWPDSEVERQVLFAEDPGVRRPDGVEPPDQGRQACA